MRKTETDVAPEALNDLGQLGSAVGHHVINAFSAIVSNAELLRIKAVAGAGGSTIDPVSIANMIIDTAVEASTVARRLIDYTRPITTIGQDRVALDRLIADYVETRRDPDGISWSTQLDPVPAILGNAGQLRSMLDLLVANASEAMESAAVKAIVFTTSVNSRGWVMLEVRDSGGGMEPNVLERAVEPFFSTKGGHLGVGLSIANGIWRRHRGTLSLRSRPGEGTTLRLCVEPCPS